MTKNCTFTTADRENRHGINLFEGWKRSLFFVWHLTPFSLDLEFYHLNRNFTRLSASCLFKRAHLLFIPQSSFLLAQPPVFTGRWFATARRRSCGPRSVRALSEHAVQYTHCGRGTVRRQGVRRQWPQTKGQFPRNCHFRLLPATISRKPK